MRREINFNKHENNRKFIESYKNRGNIVSYTIYNYHSSCSPHNYECVHSMDNTEDFMEYIFEFFNFCCVEEFLSEYKELGKITIDEGITVDSETKNHLIIRKNSDNSYDRIEIDIYYLFASELKEELEMFLNALGVN